MTEEQEPFEEDSLFDSEPFVNILYSFALIFIGVIVVPVFSNTPSLAIAAIKVQTPILIIGLICFVYNLYYYLSESGYLTPPLPTNDLAQENALFDRVNRDPIEHFTIASTEVSSVNNAQRRLQPIKKLTAQILEEMDWLRFEMLCSAYFSQLGIKNSLTGLGADDGIDIKIYDEHTSDMVGIVQCKCHSKPISVKLVREFYGVMSSLSISKGYFITSSSFHQGALKFARELNMELIDGRDLLYRFNKLSSESQTRLYEIATKGDYKTPSCANCGRKMVERTNKQTGKPFWACPKGCRSMLHMKTKTQ